MTILLAQAVSSAFLIDPVKPVLLLVPALVGAALTSRLTKDIRFCGLPSEKWHAMMIGGTLLGLALGLLGSSLSLPFGLYVLICQRTAERYVQDNLSPVSDARRTAAAIAILTSVLVLLPMAPELADTVGVGPQSPFL